MEMIIALTAAMLLLSSVSASATGTYCARVNPTADGFVSLRAGPGTSFSVTGVARPHETVEITTGECRNFANAERCDPSHGWVFVEAVSESKSPVQGWVNAHFVTEEQCPAETDAGPQDAGRVAAKASPGPAAAGVPDRAATTKIHLGDLPAEAGGIAKDVVAACEEMDSGFKGDLDSTVDTYRGMDGRRLALFDPKRICEAKGNGVCSTDGCDVHVYSEQASGSWSSVLDQAINGDFKVEEGRGSKPLHMLINVKGGVPPCSRDRQSVCAFELTWKGTGFAWKRLR
jgi:hypothetical protein